MKVNLLRRQGPLFVAQGEVVATLIGGPVCSGASQAPNSRGCFNSLGYRTLPRSQKLVICEFLGAVSSVKTHSSMFHSESSLPSLPHQEKLMESKGRVGEKLTEL